VVATAVAFAAVASATVAPGPYNNATFNAANAPTGTHLQRGSPSCTVSNNLSVSCVPFELAGVGNTNAQADLSATYSATVVCINGGGNPSDSQHQGTFTSPSSTGQLQPKNGRLTVTSLSVTAPTERQFLAQQTCPNPNWKPMILGGITLSSFTYTVTFVGFSGPYITITATDP
jgi:hypothetical protein